MNATTPANGLPAVEVRDLVVTFRSHGASVQALRGISFVVPQGQVVGFLGPNGAGKTTTLHVLLGFQAPTSGGASIFGEDVTKSVARRRLGYMPEHPQAYPFLTGRELLNAAGRIFGMSRSRAGERAAALLGEVDLAAAADRRIATYSRGMLQRIGLAQALVNDPDLVILDEPTSGLDPVGRSKVRNLVARLRDAGKTVFFSSHELSEVELVCDRVLMLVDGAIAASGAVGELVGRGESLERYFLKIVSSGGG